MALQSFQGSSMQNGFLVGSPKKEQHNHNISLDIQINNASIWESDTWIVCMGEREEGRVLAENPCWSENLWPCWTLGTAGRRSTASVSDSCADFVARHSILKPAVPRVPVAPKWQQLDSEITETTALWTTLLWHQEIALVLCLCLMQSRGAPCQAA